MEAYVVGCEVGLAVMEAYVVGCEVGLAVDYATHYHTQQMHRGFHSTAILGRLAAAAACAKLLKLDEEQTTMALGMAGSMAGGVIHNFGTMTKPLHAGMTCRDGVMAAQLAQRGFTAGDQILEHPVGFTATVIGDEHTDLEAAAEKLGKPFHVQDALMIKKYPSCGGNHAMLDSVFGLMREYEFGHEDVANAEIVQSYASTVMLYEEPETDLKGKFSAKYNMAAALVDGQIGIDTFTDEKVADADVVDMMERVRIRVKTVQVRARRWHGIQGCAHPRDAEGRARDRTRDTSWPDPGQPGKPVGHGEHRRQVPGQRGPGPGGRSCRGRRPPVAGCDPGRRRGRGDPGDAGEIDHPHASFSTKGRSHGLPLVS